MMKFISLIYFFVLIIFVFNIKCHKSLEELKKKAKYINSLNTTWKASYENFSSNISIGTNFNFDETDLEYLNINQINIQMNDDVPNNFDTRENWPECKEITGHIHDQGICHSCWAVAAASVISDRICIASKGEKKVMISSDNLLSCCMFYCGTGCNGGYPIRAFKYWVKYGLVSGGDYGDTNSCRPYQFIPCSHDGKGLKRSCKGIRKTPRCERKCVNGANYKQDLHYGAKSYRVRSVKAIQLEILKNGPVEATFSYYDDFDLYKSGVYQRTPSSKYIGGHCVKILGWGVENNVPYWLAANSWNDEWGDKGLFKFLRGKNHCNIETYVVTGIPKL